MMDTGKQKNEAEQPVGGPEQEASEEQATLEQNTAEAAADIEAEARDDADAAGESEAEAVARLEGEKADLTERLLRVAADLDNLRKRAEREVADAGRYAIARFAADMLTVGDNLRRALEAVPDEMRQSGDSGAAALIEGVEMTARELDRLLEKNGVMRIAAEGERFDPHRHQAMFEMPAADVAPGTVVQVVQDGYMIGDRVLRAAMVGVARAAPGGQSAEAGDGADDQGGDSEAVAKAARSG